jgi:hypothetical protein
LQSSEAYANVYVMDVLSALVDGPRAQRAFALKAVFDGTWSITVEDRAPLTVVVVARGRATFTGPQHVTEVGAGDVVLIRGPEPYSFADSARTPRDIRILPGQVCVDPHGRILATDMGLGVRTWGNTRAEDATVMLIGTYQRETSVGSLLLSKLPAELVIRDLEPALIGLFAEEIVNDEPGQAAILDRLIDLLVVRCVRTVLASRGRRPGRTRAARHRGAPRTPVDRRVLGDAGRVVAGRPRAPLRSAGR